MSQIDWKTLWREYEKWFNKGFRSWPLQKKKIRELVEKAIKDVKEAHETNS